MSYKFSNLLAVPYTGGNGCFTRNGDCLLTAVGNRLHYRDLVSLDAFTLGLEAYSNVEHIVAREDGSNQVVMIDDHGYSMLANLVNGVCLARVNLKERCSAVKCSPGGDYIVIGTDSGKVAVWEMPTEKNGWQFCRCWEALCHSQKVNSLEWSPDLSMVISGSNDGTVKVFSSLQINAEIKALTFLDHRNAVKHASFGASCREIISISRENSYISWEWCDEETFKGPRLRGMTNTNKKRHISENEHGKLRSSDFPEALVTGGWKVKTRFLLDNDKQSKIETAVSHRGDLVVGLTTGEVQVYKQGELALKKSVSANPITSLAVNSDAEWIFCGIEDEYRSVVFEWKSESIIFEDNNDPEGTCSISFLPAGTADPFSRQNHRDMRMIGGASRHILASGSMDGKLKLWDVNSSRAFATIEAHDGPITGVKFTSQLNGVVTCSKDGLVRAFDLVKCKKFREFTIPLTEGIPAAQLGCMDLDLSTSLVAAGSTSSDCQVYVWSFQTGVLVDTLCGHTQPITGVKFSPSLKNSGLLATSSLDSSVRLWNLFSSGEPPHVLPSNSGSAMCLAFDPRDNGCLAVSYGAGQIMIWAIESHDILGTIDGLRDIDPEKEVGQVFGASKSSSRDKYTKSRNAASYFSEIAYSGHGAYLVCISERSPKVSPMLSKKIIQICVYSTRSMSLVDTIRLTQSPLLGAKLGQNRLLRITEAGVTAAEMDLSDDERDRDSFFAASVFAKTRRRKDELNLITRKSNLLSIKVRSIRISDESRQMAVGTSRGVFCFSLEGNNNNSISTLAKDITSHKVLEAVKIGNTSKALNIALSLNDPKLITIPYTRISPQDIPLVAKNIPTKLFPALIAFIRGCLSIRGSLKSSLGVHLIWLLNLLWVQKTCESIEDSAGSQSIRNSLLVLVKELEEMKFLLNWLFEENRHMAGYMRKISGL